MALQIAFHPDEFNFIWKNGYYQHAKNKIYLTADTDISGEKIYTLFRNNDIVYMGKIPTKIFAEQLFRNTAAAV